jgi:hypothetical protein
LLSVVVEFDGGGRLGADQVVLTGLSGVSAGDVQIPNSTLKTASFAVHNTIPNIILEFSDGSFGTLSNAWPLSATGNTAFNSGSAADEYAMEFQLPFPCKVDGFWTMINSVNSSANFDVCLYDGTTALATASFDGNQAGNAARLLTGDFAPQELTENTTYRLALKPTTANNVTIYHFDVANANHFQAHAFGTSGAITSRVDGGAWDAPTTTRRPFMGIKISALDDGAGGGGGSGEPGNLHGGIHQ